MIAEERQELMKLARELHAALQVHNKMVNILINKCIGEADRLKLEALAGMATEPPVMKAMVYTTPEAPKPALTLSEGPPKLASGKRACSLCRQPGHRATNCPNAHVVQEQKKAAVKARPVKKTRGPVSPERRAQLAEQLKKARAARGRA